MDNNSTLRRIRYALAASDEQMAALLALKGHTLTTQEVCSIMGRAEDEGTVECSDALLSDFLDALIIDRRGPPKPGRSIVPTKTLTNNMILKKLRIAMKLHEADMLHILATGEHPLSRGELTALFRKPEHKHYRECGDQILRSFLRGLALQLRAEERASKAATPAQQ